MDALEAAEKLNPQCSRRRQDLADEFAWRYRRLGCERKAGAFRAVQTGAPSASYDLPFVDGVDPRSPCDNVVASPFYLLFVTFVYDVVLLKGVLEIEELLGPVVVMVDALLVAPEARATFSPGRRTLSLTTAVVTMSLIPLAIRLAPTLYSRSRERFPKEILRTFNLSDAGLQDNVIIAGHGRVGALVAQLLHRLEQRFVVIDSNLHPAGARLVVERVRGINPDVHVVACLATVDQLKVLGRLGSTKLCNRSSNRC